MKSLTVVTITFNDTEGLKKTRDSLSFDLINWIVIDGSIQEDVREKNRKTLNTAECILIQEPDNGRFDAMNKGLNLVETELVTFLNSGDMHADFKVPRQMISSHKTHAWDWAVGQTICVDSVGSQLWSWPMPVQDSLKFKLSIRSYSHQATVYRTNFLREMGGYYPQSLYSDWLISLKMSRHSNPYIHSKVWCHFLGGGVSSNQSVEFWAQECIRLRRLSGLQIAGNNIVDSLMQYSAALLIKIDRGKMLMRPDLDKKYNISNKNDG